MFIGGLLCLAAALCSAQINLAALAQFKYNQQQALAKSLQKQQTTASAKGGRNKRPSSGALAPQSAPNARPAVIKARNPTFTANYGLLHHKNIR